MSLALQEYDCLPEGFLDAQVKDLRALLGGPSLIYLKGALEPPLFVSTLLHGNEHSGILALQRLFSELQTSGRKLERSLYLLIGNVFAAEQNMRRLDHQPDYNRVWNEHPSEEGKLAEKVTEILQSAGVIAAIDIHNNSGENPVYSCVAKLDERFLELAGLFSQKVVYASRPIETLGYVLAQRFPTVTLECGVSGLPAGVEQVYRYLHTCLMHESIPRGPEQLAEVELYESLCRLMVPEGLDFSFGAAPKDSQVIFREDLDSLNFCHLPADSLIGWSDASGECPVLVEEFVATDNPQSFIYFSNNEIRTTRSLVPAMMSTSKSAVELDCLGYLMKPKSLLRTINKKMED